MNTHHLLLNLDNIENFNFTIRMADGETIESPELYEDSETGNYKFDTHSVTGSFIIEHYQKAASIQINLYNPEHKKIKSIDFEFDYVPEAEMDNWRAIYNVADSINEQSGMFLLKDLPEKSTFLTSPCGIFANHTDPGLFIATIIPQTSVCNYRFVKIASGIRCICTTQFHSSQQTSSSLHSEQTYLSTHCPAGEAFHNFSQLYPLKKPLAFPQCGYSTWDYYFSSVTMQDVLENINELENFPSFKSNCKVIQLDDGWQYLWGEWEPNYKFPDLKTIASTITSKGYTAGIWTAPLIVQNNTYTALRDGDALIKNNRGDPYLDPFTGNFMLDPTSPAGEKFIIELFTKLYDAGFRYFKIDFIFPLLSVPNFYQKDWGVYDVIRHLFFLVRKCVKDSHIMGCSLPFAAGAGVADSGRTGLDIHNQWSHVVWAVERYMTEFWLQNRIWINDIDYLVVRGSETSTEEETNVLDFNKNADPHPRWRSGPVFNEIEAQTWANIVKMSGSNLFVGDRLSALNEKGKTIIENTFPLNPNSARPLDICERELPSFWLQHYENRYTLTIINWGDAENSFEFDFDSYHLNRPKRVQSGDKRIKTTNLLKTQLMPHGSIVFEWEEN